MRVISGSARGMKLRAPKGISTRPTVDRIKESLFNIIANDLSDISFLDLFSGSGGIGIEALSRGAKSAVFVDSDYESVKIIEDNIISAKMMDRSTVLKSDVQTAVAKLKKDGKKFDIIFMDPPYSKGLVQKTVSTVFDAGILKKDGFIIAEQPIEEALPNVDGFNVFRVKEYKITKMTFISYLEEDYE